MVHRVKELSETTHLLRCEKNNWIREYEKSLESHTTRFPVSVNPHGDKSHILKDHFVDLGESGNISRIPFVWYADPEDCSRLDEDLFKKNLEGWAADPKKIEKLIAEATRENDDKKRTLDGLQKSKFLYLS